MQFSHALNPRRIARSLTAVLTLTLLQMVAAPIIAPTISVPKSSAVSGTFTASSSTSRSYITIPAGVESITLTITGGGGGQGGSDGDKAGGKGGMAQRIVASFAVTPGDVVSLFPGNAGANGVSGANINTGGSGVGGAVAGGASTTTDSYWNINDTHYQNPSFNGGAGGKVGALGGSGSGGGGGAASVVAINRRIVAIAGGAGGGGGAGNTTGAQGTDGVDANTPHSNLMYGGAGKDSGAGLTCSASDGGGGGGGGGGYLAGTGGNSELVGTECSGRGGFRGNALVYNALTSSVSSFNTSATPASPLNGSITYSYDVKSPSVCTPTTTTVDIYTVLKFDASINCTWTVPATVSVIDIFAVGGGGGGGDDGGTGGGGGAGLSRSAVPVTPNSSLTIRVGYGGRGGNFNAWSSEFGETSTVTTSTGTFNAPGGQGGGNRATGRGAGGSAAVNGTFAGGAGGTYPSLGAVGGVGNFGISNYFFGLLNTYAGGGGGGCYFNTYSDVAGALGRNGGGAGCSNTAAIGQTDGINGTDGTDGTDGTGGGGGGGGAGPAGRVMGGKGGSGVVLIRYATNAADSFPASAASALSGRWTPNELQLLDSSRKGWVDSSGTNANASITGLPIITTQGTLDGGNSTGSSKSNLIAAGGTSDKTTFISGALSNYTMLHVARYPRTTIAGGAMTAGRLVTASSGNFISGHYNSANERNAHHNVGWMTPTGRSTEFKWLLSTDMTKMYRGNGVDYTYKADYGYVSGATAPTGLGINNFTGEPTDWQMLDVLVFNRQLTNGEIRAMESYLARIYGLTIDVFSTTSDTDTAATMGDANYYFFNGLGAGNTLNDTFTVEAWIKPTSSCDSNICQIVVKENTILFGIHSGYLHWALYGTSVVGWNWTNTGIRIKPDEWQHVSMVKQFTGDKNGSLLFYLNGKLAYTHAGSPYASSTNYNSTSSSYKVRDLDDNWFLFGGRGDQWFYGQIDEIKIWNVARVASDVAIDMHSNDGTSSDLKMYYNFNMDKLLYDDPANDYTTPSVSNMAYGGVARSDLYSYYGAKFVPVESRVTTTPYTTVTFPRTIITKNGGWKAPEGISQIQVAVVAGGGGGGGGFEGGGGGGGGFIETITTVASGSAHSVKVGTGGRGTAYPLIPTNGDSSAAFGITALGGGSGAVEFNDGGNNVQYAPGSGGSGGGGSWYLNFTGGSGTVGQGNKGGNSSALQDAACGSGNTVFAGGGGGGAAAAGQDASCLKGGNGGTGKASTVLGATVAAGGGGSVRPYTRTINSTFQGLGGTGGGGNSAYTSGAAVGATGGATNGTYGTGSGGGAGYAADGYSGYGGNGGTGVVAIRYITAAKPTYTKPTNAYLNVGMTETFTTNVAVDSATAVLTRTFKWESTTPSANGVYTTLKVGTGAANAAYSWVPTDTSTSGSGYLYRLTVTDSNTAGLFITDSSTAFAVINPTLLMSGATSIKKQINIARNETFTISAGTPGYRYTLSPTLPGITLDTSTVGTTLLKISDTASVGSYNLTLTVIDSVSASVSIPIALTISSPPNLVNGAQIIEIDLVFNIDMANTASYSRTTGTVSDISGTKKQVTINGGSTFSDDYSGILKLSNTQHISATGFSTLPSFTIEAYINLQSISSGQVCVFSSEQNPTNVAYFMCIDSSRTVFTGFFNGSWTYKRTSQQLTLGAWTHLVGTFDSTTAGTKMELYFNGSVSTLSDSAQNAGLVPPTASSDKAFINKWFYTSTAPTSAMDIGFVRLYSAPFTQVKVTQNYNATKDRFTTANINQLKPTQKYGLLNLESFTATSGGDTKTVSFAVGNRSGISWDTTTVPSGITLAIQESLSVGTYNDTVTVTDNFGQSTYLPIRVTITKADTLTVSMDTATVVSYNGLPITIYPKPTIRGLKGFDTATSLTRFSSSLYTESTVVPTNADTYTVRGAEPVFSIGALSNYQGVIYETKTAVVNKIRQRALNIFKYGGTVGSGFVIQLQGGDGTGAVTETLTGVSTLTGCAISNRILTASEQKQGYCEVRVVKAGDQNYFAEIETAQLYFMSFSNSQPTNKVGSGATIGLNGITSVETSTVLPPSITGLSTLTISRSAGGTFTITGTGFTGSISVKFWRNKVIITTSGNGTSIDIPVLDIANSGATSGRIAVITAAGEAVSVDSLTITP